MGGRRGRRRCTARQAAEHHQAHTGTSHGRCPPSRGVARRRCSIDSSSRRSRACSDRSVPRARRTSASPATGASRSTLDTTSGRADSPPARDARPPPYLPAGGNRVPEERPPGSARLRHRLCRRQAGFDPPGEPLRQHVGEVGERLTGEPVFVPAAFMRVSRGRETRSRAIIAVQRRPGKEIGRHGESPRYSMTIARGAPSSESRPQSGRSRSRLPTRSRSSGIESAAPTRPSTGGRGRSRFARG